MTETQDPPVLRFVGRILGIAILMGAVALAYYVTRLNFHHPRTDDAEVRANLVGIAPHVAGPLIELHVVDNQEVKQGDLLFVIDPQPYEAALAGAQAALLLAKSELSAMSNSVSSAVAAVAAREADLVLANSDLNRYLPLLKDQAIDVGTVDLARARQRTATAQLEEARQTLLQQQNLLGQFGSLNARISAAESTVTAARLNVDYCRVHAPFTARVANLNIAVGQYAQIGQPLFVLVDTERWYVIANFRETYLESLQAGLETDVFLMAYPGARFRGTIQGVGWAVRVADGSAAGALADVRPTLNWVRLAQRIPVRINLENSDTQRPFRMGMSAVVTVQPRSAKSSAR
ncbi:MAG TPA: HlyD family secretion protein [Verrucomicrobiota bacterium]|nr:secretion protein HlyD [Verrucomicrobiales bacterium]HRI15093.1 HlyD family secretion protein [Verrucomicrobiota bacterium]